MFFRRKKISKTPMDAFTGSYDVLELKVPKELDPRKVGSTLRTAPIAAEQMFASLHGLLRQDKGLQEHISFEIVASEGIVKFYAVVPSTVSKFVESQIYAQNPHAHISVVDDYVPAEFKHGEYKVANLTFAKPNYFPLKTFRDFEIDPLAAITSAITEAGMGENLWFQLMIRPIADVWQEEGHSYLDSIREGTVGRPPSLMKELSKGLASEASEFTSTFFKLLAGRELETPRSGGGSDRIILTSTEELEIESIEMKLAKMGFEVVIRLLAQSEDEVRTNSLLRSLSASMKQFSTANLNSFNVSIRDNDPTRFREYKERVFNPKTALLLNIEELGAIYHLPSAAVDTPGVSYVGSKKGEPPMNLPIDNCNYIGTTVFRDRKIKFGISNEGDDRVRHMYLIGKSGTGKSTFFKNMITQDIQNGEGVGVLDPHGDLIEDLLDYIPEERVDDVVLVDPSDMERPPSINLLELEDKSQKNLLASAFVSSFKTQFGFSWGPRLEYLLNYAVLTLLEVPGTTMLGVVRLLTDVNYQNYILHFVKDPVVLKFWNEEYKNLRGNQRFITEAVSPIQNKVNRFLSSTTVRNILGQKKSTVDFWDIMNNRKILFLNLSKGKIGQDNANLLGALLVSRIQFFAMQRVNIPSEERNPFYLYVDEFQNFAGGEFESILSESRKYKLGLYLTHQFTAQLPEELLSAVFGNVGTIASFGLGAPDAKVLEREFAPYFDANDLIQLQKFHIYMKLMVDGQTSKPFSADIFKPWIPEEAITSKRDTKARVVALSREKYGVDAEYVHDKIKKWIDYEFDKGKALARQYRLEAKAEQREAS